MGTYAEVSNYFNLKDVYSNETLTKLFCKYIY